VHSTECPCCVAVWQMARSKKACIIFFDEVDGTECTVQGLQYSTKCTVRAVVQMARSKKACIIFFDEVDAIGGARFDDGAGGQRGAAHDAGDREPAGRLRRTWKH